MNNLEFIKDFLATIESIGIRHGQIYHEHDSIPTRNLETLTNEMVGNQGFKHHNTRSSTCVFLSRGQDQQIELTPPEVPQHQGWRLVTIDAFVSLLRTLVCDHKNFTQLNEYAIRDEERLLASMFRHKSGVHVQIVWRKEDIFPPQK